MATQLRRTDLRVGQLAAVNVGSNGRVWFFFSLILRRIGDEKFRTERQRVSGAKSEWPSKRMASALKAVAVFAEGNHPALACAFTVVPGSWRSRRTPSAPMSAARYKNAVINNASSPGSPET